VLAKIALYEPDIHLAGRLETLMLKAAQFAPERLEAEVYGSCGDFLAGLEEEAFSIVVAELDDEGLALGRRLRERFNERETLLIYISEQALFDARLIEVRPFLVIPKPVGDKDFLHRLFAALEHILEAGELFVIKQGRVSYQIKKREIICLESIGREIILSAKGREDIQYREALKNEREKLRTVNFVRPHNSFIVNLDYVEEYHSDSLRLANQRIAPISELRAKDVKKEILRFWEYRNI
jgi:DNA-binding LytR/AlgR family response regulator